VVFIFKKKEDAPQEYTQIRMEYVLGLLNSRLMLYYYFKKFGELEWQSFPYVTQKTLKQLPLRRINFSNDEEKKLHDQIVQKVTAILAQSKKGEVPKNLDYEIEDLVMKLYKITPEMKQHVWNELKKVQRLRIIRDNIG
jgi:chaperonin cofactor prefoldin